MPTLLDAVGILQNIGVYSVVLPFLLIFALFYALLDKTKVLGDNKFVHAAVSLVLAFLFVSSLGAVKFLTAFLPLISVLIIIILFALIAFSQVFQEGALANRPELGDQFNITQPSSEGVEGLQAFLGEEQTRVFFSPSILSLIVLVIIFGVATYYITREPARGE